MNKCSSSVIVQANPLRYRGYVYDSETGFYYLNSRYYDPGVRRFINSDGYLSKGQGLLGYNTFVYCNNNPCIHLDQSGCILESFKSGIKKFVSETVRPIVKKVQNKLSESNGTISVSITNKLVGEYRFIL